MDFSNIKISTILKIAGGLFATLFGIIFIGQLFGYLDSTQLIVKQSLGGSLTVIRDPGFYIKGFGNITKYKRSENFFFSKEHLDGGDGSESQPMTGTNLGNATANVSGVLKYRLPADDKQMINLKREYGTEDAIALNLIRNQVAAAIRQACPLFTAEEALVTRRPEFVQIVRDVLDNGEFKTYTETILAKNPGDSAQREVTVTRIFLDSTGNRVITKKPLLKQYGIEIITLDIKGIEFDSITTELLNANKKSMASRLQAENTAITARQLAITAAASAEAKVATAKGEEEVSKIRAVTQAKKDQEVAELGALKAKAQADSTRLAGEAAAYANKLKVAAGLTPQERADYEMRTRIGVAAEIAKTTFPSTMIIGGGSGGKMDPAEAIGLRSLYDLSERMSANQSSGKK